jgi:hypothetical protein
MSRSKNSRRGVTNKHGRRHSVCHDGHNCPYCSHNFKIAALRQRAKGTD